MSKYRPYEIPDASAASTSNAVMPAGAGSVATTVLSDHCAAEEHDYGYSDRCGCPCHQGIKPAW